MILHDNTKHKEEDTNSLSFLEDGTHRGSVMLYSPGRAPFGAICPAQYLWGPKEEKEEKEKEKEAGGKDDERRIWMWVHPAAFERLCAVLQSVAPKHNVQVTSMKEELLLFELRGPLSHTCITSVLFQSIVSTDNNKDFPLTVEQLWLSLGRNDIRKKPKTASAAAASSSSSSKNGERVIALRVKDPRWTFPPPPPKKQAQLVQRLQNEKGLKENENEDALQKSAFCSSALWNDAARAALSTDVPSDGEVAKQKRDSITVGLSLASKQEGVKEANDERPKKEDEMEMDTETTKTKVPREIDILLIERRTKQGVKHNIIGWDIILPSGWAMPFWKSFIYAGARAIALQERHAAATERGECSFPEDYPDTIAHALHSERVEQQLREEHLKRPPAKRPNFKELEVASPFHPRWTSLLLSQYCCLEGGEEKEAKDAGEKEGLSTSTLRVLKRKNEEEEEEEEKEAAVMEEDKEKGVKETAEEEAEVPFYVLRGEQALALFKQHRQDASSTSSSPSSSLPTSFPLCLVRVEVRMLHRGTPSWNSLLYLPLPEDEDALTQDPALWAKQEVQRQKEGAPRRRRLVGRVTSGGFSFSKGRGNAQAFCCAQLLLSSAFSASTNSSNNNNKKKTQVMVLVRKTTSTHYLPATIHPLP
ncbi:Ribonucleases P/MRP protein subunit pop1, variant 2 [Balamuthia mandrillaris]